MMSSARWKEGSEISLVGPTCISWNEGIRNGFNHISSVNRSRRDMFYEACVLVLVKFENCTPFRVENECSSTKILGDCFDSYLNLLTAGGR